MMQTAVDWIKKLYDNRPAYEEFITDEEFEEAKEMEREIAITFHQWMQINDTEQNAEKYANYSDEDMFDEFLK
jgi:hypothetical protein